MVFVEVLGFVEGLLLLGVLLQQLALQTRQIVHQYIYYNPNLQPQFIAPSNPLPPRFFLLPAPLIAPYVARININ